MDFALMSGKKKTSFEFGCTLCATLFAIICFSRASTLFFHRREMIMHHLLQQRPIGDNENENENQNPNGDFDEGRKGWKPCGRSPRQVTKRLSKLQF